MHPPTSCPDDAELLGFVLGRLPDASARDVLDHLAVCAACRRRVDDLETQASPEAAGGDAEVTDTSALHLAEAAGGPGPDEPLTQDASGYRTETLSLGFLAPPTRDRSLGRLGDYEILSLLGEGGMGIVFRAFDEGLQRIVAIKVLAPALASSAKARRRFVREARAAAAINDPHIVTIHAVGVDRETPYLVMEYIAGSSLRERIRKGPPLGLPAILRIGMQVATGLAAAHAHGVIHRDIKPANIMLEDSTERVKITDFGLALAALDRSTITSQGQLVGTPAYMSPEQIAGLALDPPSDLFSLGCVIYAMAAGRSPFQGAHTLDVIRKVTDEQPPPLHEVAPRIPHELSRLVARLLEKDPRQRPQTAAEVASLLRQQLALVNRSASDSGATRMAGAVEPTATRPRRRRWVLAIPAATLALLPLGLFLLVPARREGRPPRAVEPVRSTPLPRAVTVSQGGQGDVSTLEEALARVGPGGTVRILDGAAYHESLTLDDARRWQGLTLESPLAAQVVSAPASPALTVRGTSGVTVRGLRLESSGNQHAVLVEGAATGVTFEGVTFAQAPVRPPRSAVVRVAVDATSTPGVNVRLRRCRVENQGLGLSMIDPGDPSRTLGGVRVEECEFTGAGVHVMLWGPVRDVAITGNRFLRGINGVNVNFFEPSQADGVVIANNTFFETTYWLGLVKTDPHQKEITVCNNLILGSRKVEWSWPEQVAMIARTWSFRANWWEPGARTEVDQFRDGRIASLQRDVPLRSRDPASPEFLRPEPGSPLGSSGAGGGFAAHIGALAPAPKSP
jgi:hypothetical protein